MHTDCYTKRGRELKTNKQSVLLDTNKYIHNHTQTTTSNKRQRIETNTIYNIINSAHHTQTDPDQYIYNIVQSHPNTYLYH